MTSTRGQILRSSALIAGASGANIGFGLIRMKIAALLLGAPGLGWIGLLQNVMSMAAAVAGLGVGSSATRQVAAERGDAERRNSTARRALFYLTLTLACVGTAGLWAIRYPVARYVLHSPEFASDIGWLSLGVGLTIIAGSEVALLTGLRRIRAVAAVSVLSGAISAMIAISAIAILGAEGIVLFVLAVPLSGSLVGALISLKDWKSHTRTGENQQLFASARQMIGLGSAFMIVMLLGTAAQLAVRSMIAGRSGLVALGEFQSAWLISTTYMTLILQAMSTDYFPRLSEVIMEPQTARRIVHEQLEVALLLAAPILLLILATAPWLLRLLYSAKFSSASLILRWQIFGDSLKVASWPIAFVLLAGGRGKLYIAAEAIGWSMFVGATWLLLPLIGVQAAGVAFLLMYAVYLPLVSFAASRTLAFRWGSQLRMHFLLLLAAGLLVSVCAMLSEFVAIIVGVICASAFGLHALRKLGPDLMPSSTLRRQN